MTKKAITFEEHQRRASRAFWDKMTPKERSEWARHAVNARWAKNKVSGDGCQVTGKNKRKSKKKKGK